MLAGMNGSNRCCKEMPQPVMILSERIAPEFGCAGGLVFVRNQIKRRGGKATPTLFQRPRALRLSSAKPCTIRSAINARIAIAAPAEIPSPISA